MFDDEVSIKKVFVVVNPASGHDEPIINTFHQEFSKHSIDWDMAVTKKFGDAEVFTKKAVSEGYDVVIGYGGDGTQHELINGIMGSNTLMGILPGGTGNGFAAGLGIPKDLRAAIDIICTSNELASVDVMKMGDKYVLSRMYTGTEPEDQTSREMKDKYGLFAYAITAAKKVGNVDDVNFTLTIDGEVIHAVGTKLYVVNSGSTGVNIRLGNFDPTDGILDVFLLNNDFESMAGVTERFLQIDRKNASQNFWRGKSIRIETDNDQPIWADGEYIARTPVTVDIVESAVKIIVPHLEKGRFNRPGFLIKRAK